MAASRRPIPPAAVRKYFDDARVGYHRRARARADALAVQCSSDPSTRHHTPAVVLVHGELLAAAEELTLAVTYLEQGLAMLDDVGPHPEVGRGDRHRALLVSLLLELGRYGTITDHLTVMEAPDRPMETRLAALRTRAQLATIHGHPEVAHQYLNTASSITERIHSPFSAATVDADRANLLATQGYVVEAMGLADRLFTKTIRPVRGEYGQWAASLTASVAFTLSRHCADQGRGYDLERFLVAGIAAVERNPSAYGVAHMQLAMARGWRRRGEPARAEAALAQASTGFAALGATPALALVTLESACLAESERLTTSARSLFERALAEFTELGHAWEVAALRRHLGLADARAEAIAASTAGPSPLDMRASRRARQLS